MYSVLIPWRRQGKHFVPVQDGDGTPAPQAPGLPLACWIPGSLLVEIALAAIAHAFVPSRKPGP